MKGENIEAQQSDAVDLDQWLYQSGVSTDYEVERGYRFKELFSFKLIREKPALRFHQDLTHPSTGATAWTAAFVLSEFLAHRCNISWKDRRVLELGCGLGIVGLVLHSLDARVIMTDRSEVLSELTEKNVQENCKSHIPTLKELCWGNQDQINGTVAEARPDVIVGSDLLYEQKSYPLLLSTLLALASNDTLIYLSFEKRKLKEELFVDSLAPNFHFIERITLVGPADEHIYIFGLKRKTE